VVLSSGSGSVLGSAPRYIINLWLRSMYVKKFDLGKVKLKNIASTLDLIDRYPTLSVSISSMEHQLIEYFNQSVSKKKNSRYLIDLCTKYLMDLCNRYGMKYLYMWFHTYTKIYSDKLRHVH
jgi:hypothetical protein